MTLIGFSIILLNIKLGKKYRHRYLILTKEVKA